MSSSVSYGYGGASNAYAAKAPNKKDNDKQAYGAQNSNEGSYNAGGGSPYANYKPDVAARQRYIDAVNQGGNVSNKKITDKGNIPVGDARQNIVESYAAEFYAGGRLENAQQLSGATDQLHKDMNSNDPNHKSAATFAMVASRYKNAGGNYSNSKIEKLLESTGNNDLITGGVGDKDVETLGAVTKALRRGSLKLDQVYGPNAPDGIVKDEDKYDDAIKAVSSGDLKNNIEDGYKPGNAGDAGDAGDAGNAGGAGNAGDAGDAGDAGNAGDAAKYAAAYNPSMLQNALAGDPSKEELTQLLQIVIQLLTQLMGGNSNVATGGASPKSDSGAQSAAPASSGGGY